MGWKHLAIVGAVASFALPAHAADAKKCSIAKIGEFAVAMSGTRPVVNARINGVETKLLVDSGAFFSMLQSSAMETFKLKRAPMPPGMTVRGVGGAGQFTAGRADTFDIGTVTPTG